MPYVSTFGSTRVSARRHGVDGPRRQNAGGCGLWPVYGQSQGHGAGTEEPRPPRACLGVFDMGQKPPAKPTTAIFPCLISLAGLGAWPPRCISPSLSWLVSHAPRFRFSSAWLWLHAARANLAVGGSSGALARARA
jgi:hypothetical protein